jgi:hypothetical protein
MNLSSTKVSRSSGAAAHMSSHAAVMSFDPEASVLELEWVGSTAGMTEDEFEGSLERLAAGAEKHRAARHRRRRSAVPLRPCPEFGAWRDEHIIPRYNAAGVERFAFLAPQEAAPSSPPSHEGPATFPTGYFGSRDAIRAWFGGGSGSS